MAVFEPKIENVAEQIYGVGAVADGIQPRGYPAFAFEAGCGIRRTQMEIRCEVNLFSLRQTLDGCKHGSRCGAMISGQTIRQSRPGVPRAVLRFLLTRFWNRPTVRPVCLPVSPPRSSRPPYRYYSCTVDR